jgi:hypothetical protein
MCNYTMLEMFSFVFSYWILVWYILYEVGLTSYNPKGVLILALLENLFLLSILIYYEYPYLLTFCIINFFIKVVPLWRVRHTTIHPRDIYAAIGLFILYVIWLWINQTNVVKLMNQQIKNVKQQKPVGPVMYLFYG